MEHNKLKKKFKERFSLRFNRYTWQYIAKYKGIDCDDETNSESIDNAIETLIINIELPLVSLV